MTNFKFKEGDAVQIVNTGAIYSTYKDLFKAFGFKDLTYNPGLGLENALGTVQGRLPHPIRKNELYAVSINNTNREIIIDERGLAFPKASKIQKDEAPKKAEECSDKKKERNLIKILKDSPKGIYLYSTVFGIVFFEEIKEGNTPLIKCINGRGESILFTGEGKYYSLALPEGECILYPSRGCRDWSKFVVENQLKDKDLVWCWNRNYACNREVRFYDLKNKNTYSFDGEPNGGTFDYYEKYKEKWPDWALEAVKKLKTD